MNSKQQSVALTALSVILAISIGGYVVESLLRRQEPSQGSPRSTKELGTPLDSLQPPKPLESLSELRWWDAVEMDVAAYCPCELCCGAWATTPTSQRTTASGALLSELIASKARFCAADKATPFGTVINIPGYGLATVLDRGGAIRGARIDVFFHTHAVALDWGRRSVTVWIRRAL